MENAVIWEKLAKMQVSRQKNEYRDFTCLRQKVSGALLPSTFAASLHHLLSKLKAPPH